MVASRGKKGFLNCCDKFVRPYNIKALNAWTPHRLIHLWLVTPHRLMRTNFWTGRATRIIRVQVFDGWCLYVALCTWRWGRASLDRPTPKSGSGFEVAVLSMCVPFDCTFCVCVCVEIRSPRLIPFRCKYQICSICFCLLLRAFCLGIWKLPLRSSRPQRRWFVRRMTWQKCVFVSVCVCVRTKETRLGFFCCQSSSNTLYFQNLLV